jgi:hypothetical protein
MAIQWFELRPHTCEAVTRLLEPHPQSFLFCSDFSDRVSHFCLGSAWNHDPPTYASYIAGITSIYHHTQLTCDGGLTSFLLGLALNLYTLYLHPLNGWNCTCQPPCPAADDSVSWWVLFSSLGDSLLFAITSHFIKRQRGWWGQRESETLKNRDRQRYRET